VSHPTRSRGVGAAWGALLGFIIAPVVCIATGVMLGVIAMIAQPNDPSAGSVAELGALAIPLLTPVGSVVGGIVGWVRTSRRNRANTSLRGDA
jgi:hypothetical protein